MINDSKIEQGKDGKGQLKVDKDMNLVKIKDMIGSLVNNIDGEKLGHIEDIVVNISKGDFTYVILSSGGFLGIGEDHIAVPWNILDYNSNNQDFTLKIHHSKLVNAPSIDINNWKDAESTEWVEKFIGYYSVSGGYIPHRSIDNKSKEPYPLNSNPNNNTEIPDKKHL